MLIISSIMKFGYPWTC